VFTSTGLGLSGAYWSNCSVDIIFPIHLSMNCFHTWESNEKSERLHFKTRKVFKKT
jgi:hypothetical protein